MVQLDWQLGDADEAGVANLSLPISTEMSRALRRGAEAPHRLKALVTHPGRFADVLGLGYPSLYAVSERSSAVIAKLDEVKLTPIEIEAGPAGYSLLGAAGRCGSVDYSRSTQVRRMGPFVLLRGLHVGPIASGDFAVPDNREDILISSRAAHLIQEMKLTNVRLIRLDQVEFFVDENEVPSTSSG